MGRRQSSVCQLPASHPGFCLPAVVHHHPFNRLSPHSVHNPVCSTRQLHHDPAVTKLWGVPVVARQRGISTCLHLRQQFWGHLVWRWLCCDNWWRWSYVVTAGVEYRTTSCSGVTGIIIIVIIIIIIIIITTMFMVLSSWQSHCESSPSSFDECRMAPSGRRPKTKPDDLGCESACAGCQKLHPPSPFIITQPESWYSFYRPTEGRRLSRPSWLVTYWDGLPVHRRSPVRILTGSDVAQLRWSRPTRYH